MARVAIIAPFGAFESGYSLSSVVIDQLEGLVERGHDAEVWAMQGVSGAVPGTCAFRIRSVIPPHAMHLDEPDTGRVDAIADALSKEADRFRPNLVLTHDVIFQKHYETVMLALAQARDAHPALFDNCVHHIHSATQEQGPRKGRRAVRSGDRIVFGDRASTSVVARGYGIPESSVCVLAMPRDYCTAAYASDPIRRLIRDHRLDRRDIVQVFPASHGRLQSKGLPEAIAVFEMLKQRGRDVALVVCNAHASNQNIEYRSGVLGDDLVYTSEEQGGRWRERGLSARELHELRGVANLFLWPSKVEMSPLAVREAMLAGHLLVLNGQTPAVREFGQDDALYFPWYEFRSVVHGGLDHSRLVDAVLERLEGCPRNRAARRAMRLYSADAHARDIERIGGI